MATAFCDVCGEILTPETDHRCDWCGGCPLICSCDHEGEVEVSAPRPRVLEQPNPEDDVDEGDDAWQHETPF